MKTIACFVTILSLLIPFCAKAQPAVNLGADTIICGNTYTLNAGNAGATFVWNNGITNQTLVANSSGIYWVDVTDGSGTTRDSIDLTFIAQPQINNLPADTSVCKGIQTFTAQTNAGEILWTDSNGDCLGYGSTYTQDIQDTTTLYYQAGYYRTIAEPITGITSTGPSTRYIIFDVLEPLRLNSVRIYVDGGSFSGTVHLRNSSNQILASKAVSYATGGTYDICLDFDIPVGSNYRLEMNNPTGANLGVTFPAPSWTNYTYPFINLKGAQPSFSYPYFYDWVVTLEREQCQSALDSMVVNTLPTPFVDLGSDTTLCGGSLLLDATNVGTGFNYIWNTGATTAVITASQTGNYAITVSSNGACSTGDSINLLALIPPVISGLPADTSVCKGIQTFTAQTNAGEILWTDSNGDCLGYGSTYTQDIQDTTTLYYQAGYYRTIAEPITGVTSTGPSTRYIIFDVLEPLTLNSVRVYVDGGSFSGTVHLKNSSNQILASKAVSYATGGTYDICLDFDIPVGSDYRLEMNNPTGANLGVTFPAPSWTNYTYPFINLKGAQPSFSYPYFYDWIVTLEREQCQSVLDSMVVNTLPTPFVDLGSDTTLCGGSLLLDATNVGTGFNYDWSTGLTTASITASQTGLYAVTVSVNGACPIGDSINILALIPPVISGLPADTSVCKGIQTFTAQTNAGEILWTDSNGDCLGYGSTYTQDIQDTTTLYYQAGYYRTIAEPITGITSTGSSTRYIIFDVLEPLTLNSVRVYVDGGSFSGTVHLKNSSNQILASKAVSYATGGTYDICLDFDIPVGSNYRLEMNNPTGANLGVTFPAPSWTNYTYPFINLKGAQPSFSYPYFYDWVVTLEREQCQSVLDSMVVNTLLTPTVELGEDTTLCGGSLLLDATNVGTGFNYDWSTGLTTASITASQTGLYAVTVSVNGACPIGDTINILALAPLTVSSSFTDTSLCKGVHTFTAQNNGGEIVWIDSDGDCLGYGNTYTQDIQDTTTLYYQAGYYRTIGEPITGVTSTGPSTRYIIFDVLEPLRLNSVRIYVDGGSFSGTVHLRNSSNQILASKVVSYATGGTYDICLEFDIPVGSDYRLEMDNPTGANLGVTFPAPNWINYSYPFINLTGAQPSFSYPYFYDWIVTLEREQCRSALDSIVVNSLPTPSINLVEDTTLCGATMLLLDATYPNASYLWSDNSTNATLTVIQEGTYSVTSTIGNCSNTGSSNVYLVPDPNATVLSADTTTCAGVIPRVSAGADVLKWYTESTGGNLLGYGNVLNYNAQQTDTIWVEGHNYSNQLYTHGQIDTFVAGLSDYRFPITIRGLVFEAIEDIRLHSVRMYIGSIPLTGQIQLRDANNVLIDTLNILLTNTNSANDVVLDFDVPAGSDYRLLLTDYNQASILVEYPYSGYPITGDYVNITTGIPSGASYSYFYSWQVQRLRCSSPRVPSAVTVLPTPVIDFPTDTIICGDTLILDASAFNAQNYLWSTGETTASIMIDSNVTVSLVGTIGICQGEDSTNVFLVEPPSLIVPPNDTTVCGGTTTLFASGNAAYYAWYDSANSTIPFAVGDSVIMNFQDSTTLWVEGIGFIPKTESLGEVYDPNSSLNFWLAPQDANSTVISRGIEFVVNSPLLLETFDLYCDTITTVTVNLYRDGFLILTQNILLSNIGKNTIPFNYLFDPDNYYIEISNNTDGKLLLLSPYGNIGQLSTPEVTFITTNPSTSYNYFFNWRVSTPSCATTRLPVQIDVPPSPVISMVADTATCTLSSIVLDPVLINNSSYSYLWSNGKTTDTLEVTTPGYYGVTVTNDGTCATYQDVYVQFLSTPTAPNFNDTSICSPGYVGLGTPSNDGVVVWYDSENLNEAVSISAPYNVYIADTTQYWYDAAPRATTRVGLQAYSLPTDLSAYFNVIIASRFDVHQPAILDSVAIYLDAPATVEIVLMDSLGAVLNTATHTVNQAYKKVFVPLDFVIPKGDKYQLSFTNVTTSFLVDKNPIATPTSNAGVATLTGTVIPGVNFASFFDWHFSYAYPDCHSTSDSMEVVVSIPVDLVDSIYTCDTAIVDLTHPNINMYTWSNGSTNPITTFLDAGTYTVTLSDGQSCTVIDSVKITQPMDVGLPAGVAACDYQLSTNYTAANTSFSWSTGDTTATITIPSIGVYSLTITTNTGCTLVDTAFISQIIAPPTPNLGNYIDVCFEDTLDAGFGGQNMTYEWNTGATTQTIVVNSNGYYAVTVTHPLGCSGSDNVNVNISTLPVASFTVFKSGSTVSVTNSSSGGNQATSYFWDMGDMATYQIPSPFHTYADTGCYEIKLIVTDACGSDTAMAFVGIGVPDSLCDTTLAIATLPVENYETGMKIIPNPNTGTFQLELMGDLLDESMLILYDLNGRIVHQQAIDDKTLHQVNVQTRRLPEGMYIVRLVNRYQSVSDRVMILRE